MSQSFFEDLDIRLADANLGCGSGSQAEVTGAIMVAFERELREHLADLVLTMHRPASVDEPARVQDLLAVICGQTELPIVFPVHPRTRDKLGNAGERFGNLILVPPLSYLEFIYLVRYAKGVISDLGGISEETTYLDVPCITLRENTERPETVTQGTNRLVGHDHATIRQAMVDLMAGDWPHAQIPEKWDGRAAVRIAAHLKEIANG